MKILDLIFPDLIFLILYLILYFFPWSYIFETTLLLCIWHHPGGPGSSQVDLTLTPRTKVKNSLCDLLGVYKSLIPLPIVWFHPDVANKLLFFKKLHKFKKFFEKNFNGSSSGVNICQKIPRIPKDKHWTAESRILFVINYTYHNFIKLLLDKCRDFLFEYSKELNFKSWDYEVRLKLTSNLQCWW